MSLRHLVAPLAACLAVNACDAVQSGETGFLSFSLVESEFGLPADFDTPIAVEMTATVRVWPGPELGVGGADPVVIDARSSAPEILRVVSTTAKSVTLRAVAAGTAVLTVSTSRGEDRIGISAAGVHTVSVRGPGFLVPEAPTPFGVVGGRMLLPVSLRDIAARPVIGSGPLPLSVSVDPAGAAELDGVLTEGLIAPVFRAEGTVTVGPQAGDGFTATVVAPSAILDLELRGLESTTTAEVGTRTTVVLRGLTEDLHRVAGLDGVVSLGATASVCTLEATPGLGDGVHEVDFISPGTCTLTGTVAGDTGLGKSWTVEVTAAP